MNRIIVFVVAVVAGCFVAKAQVPDGSWQWTWMHGSDTFWANTIYVSKGVPHPNNTPGCRDHALTWTDTAGNFWLFGGLLVNSSTIEAFLCDLWKFDINTYEWTFVHGDTTRNLGGLYGTPGVPHPNNYPGARNGGATWVDSANNLWLYGGQGYGKTTLGYLSDLWKYDISTNEWTFIKGDSVAGQLGVRGAIQTPDPLYRPGCRGYTAYWTDLDGNFWLFGGVGRRRFNNVVANSYFSDLWKYNVRTNEWTWVKGDTIGCQPAVQGVQRVPDPGNKPHPVADASFWRDAAGDFWLMGGNYTCAGVQYNMADVWRYSPSTDMWTWEKGNLASNLPPVYGTQGVPATINTPGARSGAAHWMDLAGNLWIFGGGRLDAGSHRDLWKFDVNTMDWTWVKGDNVAPVTAQLGVYGTYRVASSNNWPGHRRGASGWIDRVGTLWMFGGRDRRSVQGGAKTSNDLWRLVPECTILGQQPPISGPDSICAGQPFTYSIGKLNGALNYVWSWPSGWSGTSADTTLTITPDRSSGTIRVIANNTCDTSDEQYLDITVVESDPVNITVTYDTLATNIPFAAYQWYKDGQPVSGATHRNYVVRENGTYTVQVANGYGCEDSASYRVESILSGLGIVGDRGAAINVQLWPNPVWDALHYDTKSPAILSVYAVDGRLLLQTEIEGVGVVNVQGIPSGAYLISVRDQYSRRLIHNRQIVKQ